ncbi:MAG: hypothetical protein FWF03_08230 [Defluviitaleaceae bacterium]|nr:hypothetical protein [Defluviitaleaceae bacterium]
MLMVKENYENTRSLLKVRLKTQARGFYWTAAVFAVLLVGSLSAAPIGMIGSEDSLQYYTITDYSVVFFYVIAIIFIIAVFSHRHTNARLSAFPQTNDSRYVSSLLLNFMFAFAVTLAACAAYLAHIGVFKLIAAFGYNICFALDFSAGFIAAGFFVHLAYASLILALLELIGAALRKWAPYAGVALTAVLALLVVNIGFVVENAPVYLAFILREPSLAAFFLKAAGTCLAFIAAAFILNRHTVYNKNRTSGKKITIACVVATAIVSLLVPTFLMTNFASSENDSFQIVEMEYETPVDNAEGFGEIRIDVSHLPRGSGIAVEGENIAVMIKNSSSVNSIQKSDVVVLNASALDDLQGDTIVLRVNLAAFLVNGADVMKYTNQRVEARLDGLTLVVDYIRDEAVVVIMPVWGLSRQFDAFKEKNVFPAHSFGFSSGWESFPSIYIGVE